MQAIIKPGFLKGTLAVPPSKSMMQRACAGALLHKGRTIIKNPGVSEDDQAALGIIQQLGASIVARPEDQLVIESPGIVNTAGAINCGESGLSARMFIPVAALLKNKVTVTGKGSLLKRPMDVYESVFPRLGVLLEDFSGSIPFSVQGPLQPKDIIIDGGLSSQFLTGLLYAFCYAATEVVTIEVHDLKSKPYIDLTLAMLGTFGWHVTHKDYKRFIIDPGQFEHKELVEVTVEPDWSSAAYWLAGAALSGAVALPGLNLKSQQADRKILDILSQANGNIAVNDNAVIINQSNLSSFTIDLTDSPDLFPIVAVFASVCDGASSLQGLHRLKHKESDREAGIVAMLRQLGVIFKTENDTLIIEGGRKLHGAVVNGCNDHRMVMAAAIGALVADGETIISDAQAVTKSYPSFFEHLRSLGVQFELKN